jgi:hypothetical protein
MLRDVNSNSATLLRRQGLIILASGPREVQETGCVCDMSVGTIVIPEQTNNTRPSRLMQFRSFYCTILLLFPYGDEKE